MNTTHPNEARIIQSGSITEIYLTIAPDPALDPAAAIEDVYSRMREALLEAKASIVLERLFATADAMPAVIAARNAILGPVGDDITPTQVIVSPALAGNFAGAQVYAVAGLTPQIVRCCGLAQGVGARVLQSDAGKWLFVNGLNAMAQTTEAEQARRLFSCAGCFLEQQGATMKSVARTWLWLREICNWYDQFNRTRNEFFNRQGLIDPITQTRRLPASTGIGLYGSNGAACTLDLVALPGREDSIRYVEAGGHQRSAFEYGSAFSRASVAPMPACDTIFISGTAAIDRAGRTEHVDMIDAQIHDTIAHLRGLMAEVDCREDDVFTALVYCKTQDVEAAFNRLYPDLVWPRLVMVGDVCRPDLLFEIELTGRARR
jgi:enamine deaminase RidA (YjgF/YER057c/UK114 family)